MMYYRVHSAQGYANAQLSLGLMYEHGPGVPRNGKEQRAMQEDDQSDGWIRDSHK